MVTRNHATVVGRDAELAPSGSTDNGDRTAQGDVVVKAMRASPGARDLSERNLHDGFELRLVDYIPSTFVLFANCILRNQSVQPCSVKPLLTKLRAVTDLLGAMAGHV